jgi:hypothetical protein
LGYIPIEAIQKKNNNKNGWLQGEYLIINLLIRLQVLSDKNKNFLFYENKNNSIESIKY